VSIMYDINPTTDNYGPLTGIVVNVCICDKTENIRLDQNKHLPIAPIADCIYFTIEANTNERYKTSYNDFVHIERLD